TQDALLKAQAELARMNRVTTLGTLAASIAHEINQPLTAIVTNASAGLRWLGTEQPNLIDARQALTRIAMDGNRGGAVSGAALAAKSPVRIEQLDINDVIREVIALTHSEMDRNGIAPRTRLADEASRI